jgi:hypothetical protein
VRLIAVQPRPLDRILGSLREAQFQLEMAALGSPEAEAAPVELERDAAPEPVRANRGRNATRPAAGSEGDPG